ncbi:MAG: hypothetical protein C4B59_08065 [Candidatus Methanogaster sp.]|uniref:Uncharacterized protein n=1 Tax=Candidatus Methanogaster sp. TaxID=3386292 RepID=A0AC61L3A4_9EURY|nr:MAG: hypothetical protein C4B59_08065 [ANME-2 cluster archaeon]
MAIHTVFLKSPHSVLSPDVRWFPADETLVESSCDKLPPPRVHVLRKKFKVVDIFGNYTMKIVEMSV